MFVLGVGWARTGTINEAERTAAARAATAAYDAAVRAGLPGFRQPYSVLNPILNRQREDAMSALRALRGWLTNYGVNVGALETQAGGPIPAAAPAPAPAPVPAPGARERKEDAESFAMTQAASLAFFLVMQWRKKGSPAMPVGSPMRAEMEKVKEKLAPAVANARRTNPYLAARAGVEVIDAIFSGGRALQSLDQKIAKLREKLESLRVDVVMLETHERSDTPRTPGWVRSNAPDAVGIPRGMNRDARGWSSLQRAVARADEWNRRDRDKILDWADGFRPICPEHEYQLIPGGGRDSFAVYAYFREPGITVAEHILAGRDAEARIYIAILRERLADRDITYAATQRGQKMLQLADEWARTGQVDRARLQTYLDEYLQSPDSARYNIGHLNASNYGGYYVSGVSVVNIRHLIQCDGLGNDMYRRAAEEACSRGSRLGGSGTRSPFSESFWKKQIAEQRATCATGRASVYPGPVGELERDITSGSISVPQYNKLADRILAKPAADSWECATVPLNAEWCGLPPEERVLVRLATQRDPAGRAAAAPPAAEVRPNSRSRGSRGRTSRGNSRSYGSRGRGSSRRTSVRRSSRRYTPSY